MKDSTKVLAASIVFGSAIWLADAAVDFIFNEGEFLNLLLFVPPHELHHRMLTLTVFLVFGVILSRFVDRIEKTKQEAMTIERLLEDAFEAITDGVSMLSCDLKIVKVNKFMEQKYGETIVGKQCYAVYQNRNSTCPWCPSVKALKTGQPQSNIVPGPGGEGSNQWMEIFVYPLKDANGKVYGILEHVKDITAQKQMEQEIKKNETRLRQITDNMQDLIAQIDTKGRFQYVSPSHKRMLGYEPKFLLGKSAFDYMHPEDMAVIKDGIRRATNTKSFDRVEFRFRHADGHYLWLECIGRFLLGENNKPIGVIFGARDISDRKRSEQELENTISVLNAAIESTADGLLIVDKTGKVTRCNPKFGEMWKIPKTLIDSRDDNELLNFVLDQLKNPEEFLAKVRELYAQPNAESYDVLEFKDGRVFERYSKPQKINGHNVGRVWSFRDVTERKRYEERLAALNTCSRSLNVANSFSEIYELTLDAVERMLGFEHAAFMVIHKGNLKIICQRGYPEPMSLRLPLDGTKRGITVKAATSCKPVLVNDTLKDKYYVEGIPGIRSELAVPVRVEGKIIGVLDVESKQKGAFNEKDQALLQILASHAATAFSNLEKRKEIEKRSKQFASLLKSSAVIIKTTDLHKRLETIVEAIHGLGWRRVVLSVRNNDLDIEQPEDIVTIGLSEKERNHLWANRKSGKEWRERFSSDFQRFKIGEFYHLPWSDPWVREHFTESTIPSQLSPEAMVDWDPQDLLYAPLRLADGCIVGVVSIDDPIDGKRPTRESLAPLEMFLYQAAVAIENARLIQQVEDYALHLEEKVEERTNELKEAQKRLLKSERLAAIGQLAGMVGHDLRNPLQGIAGAAYCLRTRLASVVDKTSKEMLKVIEKDIQRSNKIINDLLEYSREMKLELIETNPKSLVNETLSQVETPKGIKIVDMTRRTPKVKIDADKMRRVFINLIKNAVDAMPKGGTLTIRSRKTGDCLAISFTDTGIGMSKRTLSKLWTPLFTTKARGMGFGLPICKRIAEAHGGKISVESNPHKGSTFTVTIPISPKIEAEESEKIWLNVPESLLSKTTKT
ncbi:MAG: PAS domain S-box protein [Candidatus Bathyarchaeia archaeon]